jgi:hypothetical protein
MQRPRAAPRTLPGAAKRERKVIEISGNVMDYMLPP